jgi:hypothetical protein
VRFYGSAVSHQPDCQPGSDVGGAGLAAGGQAIAGIQDFSQNSFSNPAAANSIVMIFGTGFGAGFDPVYGYTVLTQIDVQVPQGLPSDSSAPIMLSIGSATAPAGVTVFVR